jgi:hypothetical protein
MTQSSFATRSLPQPVHPPVADRLRPPEAAARRSATQVTFCVRGVISPLLANLFLHYAFDAWMARTFAHIPFERYADDIICPLRQAEQKKASRAIFRQACNEANRFSTGWPLLRSVNVCGILCHSAWLPLASGAS